MRALAKRISFGLLGFVGLLVIAIVLTARPGDPKLWPPVAGSLTAEIHVVSHGYHSGVVVLRTAVAEAAERQGRGALLAVAQRLVNYRWLEVGWGDEGFYRSVPDVTSLTVALALRALFRPGNASVVHVVGLSSHPRASFPYSDIIQIGLSAEGFARMIDALDASFARSGEVGLPEDLGPGLYGPSRFFRGVGSFHVFNVCNHWVAQLLSAAGLPTAPILATMPQGLFLDLEWRAGLVPLPRLPAPGRPS